MIFSCGYAAIGEGPSSTHLRLASGQDFGKGYKFRGNQIWATIEDKAFRKKVVDREEQFGTGDRLVAELKVHQEWNAALRAFENKTYTIIKVHSHKPPPAQKTLTLVEDKKSVKRAPKKRIPKRKAPVPKKKASKKKGRERKGDS